MRLAEMRISVGMGIPQTEFLPQIQRPHHHTDPIDDDASPKNPIFESAILNPKP